MWSVVIVELQLDATMSLLYWAKRMQDESIYATTGDLSNCLFTTVAFLGYRLTRSLMRVGPPGLEPEEHVLFCATYGYSDERLIAFFKAQDRHKSGLLALVHPSVAL